MNVQSGWGEAIANFRIGCFAGRSWARERLFVSISLVLYRICLL